MYPAQCGGLPKVSYLLDEGPLSYAALLDWKLPHCLPERQQARKPLWASLLARNALAAPKVHRQRPRPLQALCSRQARRAVIPERTPLTQLPLYRVQNMCECRIQQSLPRAIQKALPPRHWREVRDRPHRK